MLLFSFRLPVLYNSTILAIIILSLCIITKPLSIKGFYSILKNRFVIFYFFLIFISLLFSLIPVLLNNTSDLYIIRGFLTQIINLFGLTLFVNYIININKCNLDDAITILISVYAIQSILQILALIYPGFYQFIRLFQVEQTAQLLQDGYSGIRGLALSSELTFALSTSYGMIFIIHALKISLKKSLNTFDYFCLSLNMIGLTFAGRTALIGVIISLFMIVIFINVYERLKFIFFISLFIIVFSLSLYYILDSNIVEKIFNFAFELFVNIFSGKGAQTESTNRLMEMLSLNINEKTWLIGDGRYIGDDGKYYGHVDSGYLRQVLFGGIGYVVVLFSLQILYLFYPIMNNLGGFISKNISRDKIVFVVYSFLVLIYLIVLNIKGESLFYLKQIQFLIFIIVFSISYTGGICKKHINK